MKATPSGIQYRDYQIESRDRAFGEWAGGVQRTLLVLPTGTGKTVVAGMVFEKAIREAGAKCLFLAHREELINQANRTFTHFGLETAIEMADQDAMRHSALFGAPDVVVGTVQTMQSGRLHRWPQDAFDIIVIDEAHHARAESYGNILEWFPRASTLGITATPDRGDRQNLGSVFGSKCFEYPIRDAIAEGWLCRLETLTCRVKIDLRDIKTTGDDFNIGDLEDRIGPKIEEICDAIKAEIGDRQTVLFTPAVGTARAVAQVLSEMGVPAKYAAGTGGDYGMPKELRRRTLGEFARDEFQVIVCCDLLIEGWDCPQVSCVGIIRPTRQRNRYAQMVGRGTRPCDEAGKRDCLILDFDWETDASSKDLTCSIDLFDDSDLDADVIEVATVLAAERARAQAAADRAEAVDLMEVVEEAEEVVRVKRMLNIRLTGRKAVYDTVKYDPVGVSKVLGIKPNKRWDLDLKNGGSATESQAKFLRELGMDTPDGLSRFAASKYIDKLKRRREQNLATVSQVKELLAAGVYEDLARTMSRDKAREAIVSINAVAAKTTQGSLFR